MNNKNLIFLLTITVALLVPNQVDAQALHWLSQPDQSPGSVLNGSSDAGKISANGQFVAFFSEASNIVADDDNQRSDLFIYDTVQQTTNRHELAINGEVKFYSRPTSSGRYIAILTKQDSTPFDLIYLYLFDTVTQQLSTENINNGELFSFLSDEIYLSDDGTELIFSASAEIDPMYPTFSRQTYKKDLNTGEFSVLMLSSDGTEIANGFISMLGVSVNGRYIGFQTSASNLLDGTAINMDNNLMVFDRTTDQYTLVSVKPDGTVSDEPFLGFLSVSVSNSGQVAYLTNAGDLVNGDTNENLDVFLFDGVENTRINLDSSGQQTNGSSGIVNISANDTVISFSESSDAIVANDENGVLDTFIYQINDGSVTRVSSRADGAAANSSSVPTSFSADGQSLVLLSSATDLLPNNENIIFNRVYVYSVIDQIITAQLPQNVVEAQTNISGVLNTQISADQRYATYLSRSPYLSMDDNDSNDALLDLFILDRDSAEHRIIGRNVSSQYDFSETGRYVVYISSYFQPLGIIELSNPEMVLYDRVNDSYTQIRAGSDPVVNNAGMVAFVSSDTIVPEDNNGFSDIYLYNPQDNSYTLVSKTLTGEAAGGGRPDITDSVDDIWISFFSGSTGLINNDNNNKTDSFIVNWPSGNPIRVSQQPDGTGGDNSTAVKASLSENADYVVFLSSARNLTTDDYTGSNIFQVFVYQRATQLITLVSQSPAGDPFTFLNRTSFSFSISSTGRYVAYKADGRLSFFGDFSFDEDIFLYDVQTQETQLISQTLDGDQFPGVSGSFKVVEDTSLSPGLVGVVFDGPGRYSGLENHPGHLESFLYQQGGPDVILDISVTGQGQVVGTSGISCQGTCDYDFPLGTTLNLVATPDSGFIFDGWRSQFGQCTDDSNPCVLDMNRDINLEAIFIDENDIIFNSSFE